MAGGERHTRNVLGRLLAAGHAAGHFPFAHSWRYRQALRDPQKPCANARARAARTPTLAHPEIDAKLEKVETATQRVCATSGSQRGVFVWRRMPLHSRMPDAKDARDHGHGARRRRGTQTAWGGRSPLKKNVGPRSGTSEMHSPTWASTVPHVRVPQDYWKSQGQMGSTNAALANGSGTTGIFPRWSWCADFSFLFTWCAETSCVHALLTTLCSGIASAISHAAASSARDRAKRRAATHPMQAPRHHAVWRVNACALMCVKPSSFARERTQSINILTAVTTLFLPRRS